MSVAMMKRSKTWASSRAGVPPSFMSVIGSAQPDVVRIKVYKPKSGINGENDEPGSSKKFCVDPRLTSYHTLQCLIAQAFNIKSDFTINAIQKCPVTGREQLTAIWSDWDLDASMQNVKPDSYLRLRYELTHREDGLDDWDFVGLGDFNANIRWFNVDSRSIIATVNQTAGKAASALNKAINWMYGANDRRNLSAIGEGDLHRFLDPEGRLIHANELRQAIYDGGIEPSFRKVVWRHLLNIFPPNMTGLDRIEYLKCVSMEYSKLKQRWIDEKNQTDPIRQIMRTVRKDVLRTDRTFGFYAGAGDNNVNVQSLFNILTTYCVSHPNITYCQGMNDYASTLLYVMREEALTYICFCSIMRRIRANFATDGVAIATKLHYLKILLQAIDPVFWNFLESCDAVNLYFTYRWLLLECKREFPFGDALRVLEVMWATLPIESEPPVLSEIPIVSSPSDLTIADRRSSSPCQAVRRRAISCPHLHLIDQSCLSLQHRRRHSQPRAASITNSCHSSLTSPLPRLNSTIENDENPLYSFNNSSTTSLPRSREKSLENSFSISEISEFDLDNTSASNNGNPTTTTTTGSTCSPITNWLQRLPNGDTMLFEEENSFLLFLCVGIFLTHRNPLLKQKNFDEQDISMHFDRYRRRHHADRILACARTLYTEYLQWTRKKRMLDDLNRFSAS